jgi:hypothetical protein
LDFGIQISDSRLQIPDSKQGIRRDHLFLESGTMEFEVRIGVDVIHKSGGVPMLDQGRSI